MTYKVFKTADTCKAARMALEANLFVPGWCLLEDLNWLCGLEHKSEDMIIVLAFNNIGNPIGICLFNHNQLSVFVKRYYRRMGIGSKLISLIKPHVDKSKLYGNYGCRWSEQFYVKNKIRYAG